MSRLPPARRTDGTLYEPAKRDHIGYGYRRSCAKCGGFKSIGPGWKKSARGMCCPACVKGAA